MLLEYYDSATHSFKAIVTGNQIFSNINPPPAAIRVTMDVTDRKKKIVRSFSRVFWIPSGN
jgi:hypothetical protein